MHRQSSTIGALLAPVVAEVSGLQAQIAQLAGTIQGKKDANARATRKKDIQKFAAEEKRLKSLEKKLDEAMELRDRYATGDPATLTHYQIAKIRAELRDTLWTPAAAASLSLPRAQHEGWGEKAVRIMRGLPPVVTQAKRDMDDGDVKKLDTGKNGLQTIQVGLGGLRTYLAFIISETQEGLFYRTDADPSILWAISIGEVTNEIIEGDLIPRDVRSRLLKAFRPSAILADYGDIYCAFEFGYNVVPAADADEAWTLVSITKGKPRYALTKRYSARKMLEELAAEQQADVAA